MTLIKAWLKMLREPVARWLIGKALNGNIKHLYDLMKCIDDLIADWGSLTDEEKIERFVMVRHHAAHATQSLSWYILAQEKATLLAERSRASKSKG